MKGIMSFQKEMRYYPGLGLPHCCFSDALEEGSKECIINMMDSTDSNISRISNFYPPEGLFIT
jgi:hypothetical protein